MLHPLGAISLNLRKEMNENMIIGKVHRTRSRSGVQDIRSKPESRTASIHNGPDAALCLTSTPHFSKTPCQRCPRHCHYTFKKKVRRTSFSIVWRPSFASNHACFNTFRYLHILHPCVPLWSLQKMVLFKKKTFWRRSNLWHGSWIIFLGRRSPTIRINMPHAFTRIRRLFILRELCTDFFK